MNCLNCQKPNHFGSIANMVCVEESCTNREIICNFCLFESHTQHKVLPIQVLLQHLNSKYSEKIHESGLKNISKCIENMLRVEILQLDLLTDLQNRFASYIEQEKRKVKDFFQNFVSKATSDAKFILKVSEILKKIDEKEESSPLLRTLFDDLKESLSLDQERKEVRISIPTINQSLVALRAAHARLQDLYKSTTNEILPSFDSFERNLEASFQQFRNFSQRDTIKSLLVPEQKFYKEVTLEGHKSSIRRIISLDCIKGVTLFASCSNDTEIRVWDYQSNNCVKILNGHKGQVYDLIFLRTRKSLFSASLDATIKIWSINSWKCTRTLYGHEGWVGQLAVDNTENYLYSAGLDQRICEWDIDKGTCLRSFRGIDRQIFSLEWAYHSGQGILTAGDTIGKMYLFKLTSQHRPEKIIHAHSDKILKIKYFSLNSKLKAFVTCSNDQSIKIWSAETLELLHAFKDLHTNFINDFYLDEASKILISSSFDFSIKVINLESFDNRVINTFTFKNESIVSLVWIPSSNILGFASSSPFNNVIKLLHF